MIPGKTLELTMEAVGLALRNDVPVQILAKRADWLDAEAWKVMCATINPDYKKIAVGFTLTRRDDLEPGASPHGTHSRHEAMSRTGLSHIRKRRADCRYSQFGMGDE